MPTLTNPTHNIDSKKIKLVGLTGGIGSGKSTVADYFRSLNITVIDSDQITRDLVAPHTPSLQLIVNKFGKAILEPDGSLNRAKLKKHIFQSEPDRLWLENLLHPLVKKQILDLKKNVPKNSYYLVAIPLLVETHFESAVDRVLVVDCPETEQIARVMKRDGLTQAEIEAIIQTQASRTARLAKADDIIRNDKSESDLKDKVIELHNKYSFLAKS